MNLNLIIIKFVYQDSVKDNMMAINIGLTSDENYSCIWAFLEK